MMRGMTTMPLRSCARCATQYVYVAGSGTGYKYCGTCEPVSDNAQRQCRRCSNVYTYKHGDNGYKYCDTCQPMMLHMARKSDQAVERQCMRCSKTYVYAPLSGHGTKYCADCKLLAYREATDRNQAIGKPNVVCQMCNALHISNSKRRWAICNVCYESIPEGMRVTLAKHRAPIKFLRMVIAIPYCWSCNGNVLERFVTRDGKYRQNLALDHDHKCCPGPNSCGKCLRGLLCQGCNSALGFLQDDPVRVSGLAMYASTFLKSTPVHKSVDE